MYCLSIRKLSITLSSIALVASVGHAQPIPDTSVETIVVTGTRIPRQDLTAASPVASFNRAEIKTFGGGVLEEFLNTLPQAKPDFGRTSNNPGDGTASIDLRGMGRGRTLVLLNGRRLAPAGTGSAVDINVIPSAIVERVEVVTGGASAVYGSDAVSGAVNFITRSRVRGLEIAGQFERFGDGDGDTYSVSAVGGLPFAGDKGHITVFVDYLERLQVLQGARAFSAVALNEVAGALVPAGSPFVPAGRTQGGGPSLIFNSDGSIRAFTTPGDLYNFAPENYLQTPLERWSAGAFVEFVTDAGTEFYGELIYSRPDSSRQLAAATALIAAPLTINGPFFAASARPTLRTRYDPDGDGFGTAQIFKRFNDVGPRRTASERESYRAVSGFRKDIVGGWELDGSYTYSRNTADETLENAVSLARVRQGLAIDPVTGACIDRSNGCVPVNIFGAGNMSSAAIDFVRSTTLENVYASSQHQVTLAGTGALWSLPAGNVQASMGLEYRRNAAHSRADADLFSGDALGFNSFAGADGSTDVYEAFAEAVVPLVSGKRFAESAELELGGRFSDYSGFGMVSTWKAGGQWRPVPGLRFKGMWQRAVRAPNIQEMFEVPVTNFGVLAGSNDFCAARNNPVAAGLRSVCEAQGMSAIAVGVFNPLPTELTTITQINGGNPALDVERANSVTVGFDYEFDTSHELRIGADVFAIDIDDAITRNSTPIALCALVADASNPVCASIRRAPTGEVTHVSTIPLNVATARTFGVDTSIAFSSELPELFGHDARLSLRASATHYLDQGRRQTASTPFLDCSGRYHLTCGSGDISGLNSSSAFPRRQLNSTATLTVGAIEASLRWRYLSEVDNFAPEFNALTRQAPPPSAIYTAAARNYLDIAASVKLPGGVQIRAGIDNLLKTEAPLLGNESIQANTDPSRYDVLGRRLFIGVSVAFGD